MAPTELPPSVPPHPVPPQGAPAGPWANRTVVGAGVTSALGDLSYETATVLLPGFLAVLGLPAAVLGVIEGLADAVASFTKMASGFIADKLVTARRSCWSATASPRSVRR